MTDGYGDTASKDAEAFPLSKYGETLNKSFHAAIAKVFEVTNQYSSNKDKLHGEKSKIESTPAPDSLKPDLEKWKEKTLNDRVQKKQKQAKPQELAVSAFANGDEAVTYRQEAFQAIRSEFSAMGDMVKGDTPFDNDLFIEKAMILRSLSDDPWVAFSEGTSGYHYTGDGDAKHSIWEKNSKFNKYAETFQVAVKALAQEVIEQDNTADSVRNTFMTVGKTCQQCHNSYKN
jgi:cytochrome c556